MNKLLLTLSSMLVASATAFSAHAQEAKGDAKAGEGKVAMCIGCHGIHGYQASFPEIYRVPMISGQNAKFIASALNAYKKGERKHPSMRAIAESLSDQDIADVSAYYEGHGKGAAAAPAKAPSPSAKVAELLNKGGCVACHGDNFNKPIDPSYPKVGGQPADYLFVALKSYKTEGNATWGRANGIMGGIAKQFSNAELKELAGYVSSLPGELKTVPQSRFR
ncbi:cytochrome c [Curvibacter sp. PAE-UM]|uniref:c-type cytochrome n=1 Tax=Curvibacter sp. PAE-UM TaxID=1714344 RepID=UPI00070D5780|nr:c-type cytochrome [Curvibacter sp. PAE-UM]KRH99089.1 cytochrome C [Curvibacter sp. PAE-UM]